MRHEFKYYINFSDYITIKNKLKYIMKIDSNANENGEYKIRSIYFDNYDDKVLFEKINGFNRRDKFRIRFYNDDYSFIKLEKKSKVNNLCEKISSKISKEECKSIFLGEIEFLKNNTPIFNELYIKMVNERQKPKTIVDYIREAYIYDVSNVRITFDKSVRTGLSNTNIFEFNSTIEILDSNYIILEVKYDKFLPEIIANLIQIGERSKTAISKYALCRMYI